MAGRVIAVGSAAAAGHRLAPLLASTQRLSTGHVSFFAGDAAREEEPRARAVGLRAGAALSLSELPRIAKARGGTTALLTDAAELPAHAQQHAVDAACSHLASLALSPLRSPPSWKLLSDRALAPPEASPARALPPAALILSTGRFAREYESLGALGRGGFGTVVRARHRLDGALYAVKRVQLTSRSDGERALREAQAMATLSHGCAQIVRYYGSWVEAAPPRAARRRCLGADASGAGSVDSGDGSESASASEGESDGDGAREAGWSASDDDGGGCASSSSEASSSDSSVQPSERVELFLLMELVASRTLAQHRDAAGARGWSDAHAAAVVGGVCRALAHSHACGFVHRDVSAANIFVEVVGTGADVRLGDFGLCARHLGHAQQAAAPDEPGAGPRARCSAAVSALLVSGALGGGAAEAPHAAELGTYLYASPEQWRGGGARAAAPSADVFSAGVILAELLLQPFATGHERAHALCAFRERGALPDALVSARPQLTALAREMAALEPSARPTAADAARRADVISREARAPAAGAADEAGRAGEAPAEIASAELRSLQLELDQTDALIRELAEAVRDLGAAQHTAVAAAGCA
jgi:serine/threonine protein kinase